MITSRILTRLTRPVLELEAQQARKFGNLETIEHIKKLQKRFAIKDGVPLYLKRGLPDAILHKLSMIGVLGGTAYSYYMLFLLAYGKAK
ncbi:putative cytochrome c oxidase subunit 7A3, mitochondrial [Varroa jacobsoni]|uniref:Uncharacterized protein n=1 Tax=Varroa destructor TaxID=109461 RepID=A0A7M7KD17_VARDE|nr:putative cytochrome c oxidase subunit 7A3, mitochondrial [Varroa destructor]XP_022704490.1 putative cytochrome c oxidase subunit 7A3, mitochondrial [Varroa jacobsoni]